MFIKIIILGLSIALSSAAFAKPNAPKGNFAEKLKKKAGDPGPFVQGEENFPKSYFLVSKNIPYMVGMTLHHPKSSSLELSKEQIDSISKIKESTVPAVIKMAQSIKKLELELANNIGIEKKDAKSQYELVDKIANQRATLTKAHLDCISAVQGILTKEQYERFLTYATAKPTK